MKSKKLTKREVLAEKKSAKIWSLADKGLNRTQIAKKLGISRSVVRYWLDK